MSRRPIWAPKTVSEETVNRLRCKLRASSYSVDGKVDLERLFRKLDRNGSGTLSRAEFSRAIKRTLRVSRIPKHEIRMLLDIVDSGRTNAITYEDFARFVLREDEEIVPLRRRRRSRRRTRLNAKRVIYKCMIASGGERFVSVSVLRDVLSDPKISTLSSTRIES